MGLTPMAVALSRAGMSQSALARLVRMSPQALAHWCAGKVEPQPDILNWVVALGNAIEKNPPPVWVPGRGPRNRNHKNGRDARGDSAPAIRVTPKVGAGAKHDLRPAERGRRMETRAPGSCDIGASRG
jgi:transcriptional regulator with XRE-family HTH domain